MKQIVVCVLMLVLGAAAPEHRTPALGTHGMVASEQHYATQVGVDVLRAGGNAVDAAVAVGYALAVVDPCCGNIGGGGFMLLRRSDGSETFLDFREAAPGAATRTMFLDKKGNVIPDASTKSWKSVGVPGTVAGLEFARTHFGTMSRARLIQPAIDLATRGFVLDPGDVKMLADNNIGLSSKAQARTIFTNSGKPFVVGHLLRQPELARSLQLIGDRGTDAFYRGALAKTIVRASRANGGILTLADFAGYRVRQLTPLHCRYRGYLITAAPPPSSGGTTMCEILNVVSFFPPLSKLGYRSAQAEQIIVEAERRAYADRNYYLGDPDQVHNPLEQLLSLSYAKKLRDQIGPRATPSRAVRPGLGPIPEETHTTHYSIVDRYGNAVAVTYTINDDFGSDIVVPGTGFILNDEMDDFTSKPGVPNMYGLVQGLRNSVRPGARPLSSMAPTIVTKNGKLFMVTGAPGGSTIITTTMSTIQNVVDFGMNVQQAVDAPRVHHQWLPDDVEFEPGALDANAQSLMAQWGYHLVSRAQSYPAEAIVIDQKTHRFFGGSDHRRTSGLAEGY